MALPLFRSVEVAAAITDRVLVAVSGGKDSAVEQISSGPRWVVPQVRTSIFLYPAAIKEAQGWRTDKAFNFYLTTYSNIITS